MLDENEYSIEEVIVEISQDEFCQLMKRYIDEKKEDEFLDLLKPDSADEDFAFALRYCAETNNTEFFDLSIGNYIRKVKLRTLCVDEKTKKTLMQFLLETQNLPCLKILLQYQTNLSAKSGSVRKQCPKVLKSAQNGRINLGYLMMDEMLFALRLFMEDRLPFLQELLGNPLQIPVYRAILDKVVQQGKIALLLKLKESNIPLIFTDPNALIYAALHVESETPGMTETLLSSCKVDFRKLHFPNGNTILHHCIANQFYSLLAYILRQVQVNQRSNFLLVTNQDGLTALALACEKQDIKALHFFQMRSFFNSALVCPYVNAIADGSSLLRKLIKSNLVADNDFPAILNHLDAEYRDQEGCSYLELFCEQIQHYANPILLLLDRHPELIKTLSPYNLGRCLNSSNLDLSREVLFLSSQLPQFNLKERLRQLGDIKKAVLQCCKPWNFTKLLNLKAQHNNHSDFNRLLVILSKEQTNPDFPRTPRQCQALAALAKDDQDALLATRKATIIDELLAYQALPNVNMPRVDSLLVAVVCAEDMGQVNECITQQIQIHSGIKIAIVGPANECPEHMKPMGHWLLKYRYWTLLLKLDQPSEPQASLLALE